MENGLFPADPKGMSCIVPSLEPNYDIRQGGKVIDYLALPFIPPLGAK
jgi:hypothetical protein